MGQERIVSLQILRFVAAMMVVFAHSAFLAEAVTGHAGVLAPGYAAQVGTAGVDIFFVISGFVIALTGPFARPQPSGAKFFWRRWSRVAPMFYLVTLFSLPIIMADSPLKSLGAGTRFGADKTIATLFFWPGAGRPVEPYLVPGWTLCFEMAFYSAMALILTGGKVRRNAIVGGMVICALVIMRATTDWFAPHFLANPMMLEFAVGVGLAALWPRLRAVNAAIGILFVTAGASMFAADVVFVAGIIANAEFVLRDELGLARVLEFGLPAALIVTGALICNRMQMGRVARTLARMGDASYSIYLVQAPVLLLLCLALMSSTDRPAPASIIVLGLASAAISGVIGHHLLERPLLRRLRSLRRSSPLTARLSGITETLAPPSRPTHL